VTAHILVVGGMNVDTLARVDGTAVPATSNPGRLARAAGGVGRNVAANLSQLGDAVTLVGAVGEDEDGDFLLDSIREVDTSRVRRIDSTGSYLAVIDGSGELVIGVADMTATESLVPADIGSAAGFDWVCADGNLLPETLAAVVAAARDADVPAVLDPVGVAKARRLGTLDALPVHTFTPNHDELTAFAGTDGLLTAVGRAHDRGVQWLWLREGAAGSRLYGPDGRVRHIPAYRGDVVDVTGAGDAMLAGYVHALGQGADPAAAAEYGAAAAALTIASPEPVRPDLDAALLERTVAPPT